VPLFDISKKADDVYLEDLDHSAGIRASRSNTDVVSLFVTLRYDISAGSSDSGNYFEVTIVDAGSKDIGIGLGTSEHFPVQGQMPGWEAHSYGMCRMITTVRICVLLLTLGYHGDDGKKFGANPTDGIWYVGPR
jgi:hypothetical protein